MAQFNPTIRTRRTPFSRRVEEAGVKGFTVYNRMQLATYFRTVVEDYRHLKSAVQLWDVSVERQVEISGPDATKLVQMTTPRDLSKMKDDQCYYIPNVGPDGLMLNDPVLNKIGEDRFWVSLADSDMLLYYKGLAAGFGLNVKIFEPDIHPLAIQGPKADILVERLFGQDIVDTKFFRHKTINFNGTDMIIARSGWSLQSGFEIYMDGWKNGEPLWDWIMQTGRDLDIHAGCPNGIERIEGGLLSFGSDMTMEDDPYQAGLAAYCKGAHLCLGAHALSKANPPSRKILAMDFEGDPLSVGTHWPWPVTTEDGQAIGTVRSAAYSPDFKTNMGIAMIDQTAWDEGTIVKIDTPIGQRDAKIRSGFWL